MGETFCQGKLFKIFISGAHHFTHKTGWAGPRAWQNKHTISWVDLLMDILQLELIFTQVERSTYCTMVFEEATRAVKLYEILRTNFIPERN